MHVPDHPPFHIILHQPEIPPNTGNILRICAAGAAALHLVGPLGFRLDARSVRRAGMDYQAFAQVIRWTDWPTYWKAHPKSATLFLLTTKGRKLYHQHNFLPGTRFLFGSEGAGLPSELLKTHSENTIPIPMPAKSRSLKLANSVAIVLFEALRQNRFLGLS